jgi:LysM repeat protein
MKRFINYLTLLLSCAFISSCATTTSESRAQSQSELIVQEIYADVGDLKHQIHNLGVDLTIIEDKLKGQDREISGVQKKNNENQQFQKQHIQGALSKVEKKVGHLQSERDNVTSDIHQLKRIVNDLSSSIGQYKTKLQEFEKIFTVSQEQSEKNIAHLKNALESLMTLVKQKNGSSKNSYGQLYKVKSGDSLEKIAKKNNTTVERIKKTNHLTSDLIIVGDELYISE